MKLERRLTMALFFVMFAAGIGIAQSTPRTVRVGFEAVGTFSWVTFAMEHYGIDEEVGFEL